MRVFHHLGINTIVNTIYIQWEFNAGPTRHETMLSFWISLVWVYRHHEGEKTTGPPLGCCEMVAYIWVFSFLIMKPQIPSDKKQLGHTHQW